MATRNRTAPTGRSLRPVPSTGAEQVTALERIGAYQQTAQARALHEAEHELENGLAILDVLLQALEASPGDEHKVTVVRIAAERLKQAALHLDCGDGIAARAYRPGDVQS